MYKLYERNAAPGQTAFGLSCDEEGLFLGGACPLVAPEIHNGVRSYRTRPPEELNRVLSAGFGTKIDFTGKMPALRRVAALLDAGDWGRAQVAALQLRLPELPDPDAVDRLLKADRFLRFNPNHKPPGPEGGQFTSGPNGAQSAAVPKLGYRTTGGAPNTPFWGTEFKLSKPSMAGGYIVQKIETHYEIGGGDIVKEADFWESFQVLPGAMHTIYANTGVVGGGDDLWAGGIGYPDTHGVQVDVGTARFYEGMTEEQMIAHGFKLASVGSIGGKHQLNTDNDPHLLTVKASNAIVRVSKNKY